MLGDWVELKFSKFRVTGERPLLVCYQVDIVDGQWGPGAKQSSQKFRSILSHHINILIFSISTLGQALENIMLGNCRTI